MSNQENQLTMAEFLMPEPGRLVGGQPTSAQLKAAAGDGLKWVVDLRLASEDHGFDEPAVAAEYGLTYVSFPIAGEQDLTRENTEKLYQLLEEAGEAPMLVHCASGNRVGALMALGAVWLQNISVDEALALGRRWGLTRMEPVVIKLLAF